MNKNIPCSGNNKFKEAETRATLELPSITKNQVNAVG